MRQRAITAVLFAAVMTGGVYGGIYTFSLLFAVVAGGCLWELTGLLFTEEKFRRLRRALGVVAGLMPFLLICTDLLSLMDQSLFPVLYALFFILIFSFFAVELFLASAQPFTNIGYYLICIVYIGLPFALLADISQTPGGSDFEKHYAPHRVFGLLWLIWTNDTMAYLIGSRIGKRKFFERISPKKTWEGTIGGACSAVLMAWGLSQLVGDYTTAQWLALGAVAAVFGTLGDLVESMLKRSHAVKDSGDLFPGHGGFLDRFDAFVFALPFFWLTLQIF